MPFQIGGHPGFHCPLYKEESYEDYELVFEQKENLHRSNSSHRNWTDRHGTQKRILKRHRHITIKT